VDIKGTIDPRGVGDDGAHPGSIICPFRDDYLRSRYDARHASPEAASGPTASATVYISSDASAVPHQRDHAAKTITQRIFSADSNWQNLAKLSPDRAIPCQLLPS
jgi:hypothetical protein